MTPDDVAAGERVGVTKSAGPRGLLRVGAAPVRRAGVVAQLGVGEGARLRFFPAEGVQGVVARPPVSRVPGSALGVALVAGRVAAVLPVGEGPEALLLGGGDDGPWLLDGLEVVQVGWFDAEPPSQEARNPSGHSPDPAPGHVGPSEPERRTASSGVRLRGETIAPFALEEVGGA